MTTLLAAFLTLGLVILLAGAAMALTIYAAERYAEHRQNKKQDRRQR